MAVLVMLVLHGCAATGPKAFEMTGALVPQVGATGPSRGLVELVAIHRD